MKKDLYEEEIGTGVVIIRKKENSEVVGLLLVSKYSNGTPCFTSYLQKPGGFYYYGQSDDCVKELKELRSYFYSDCDYCNNYPCTCTPEELERYKREEEEFKKESEHSEFRSMMLSYAEGSKI